MRNTTTPRGGSILKPGTIVAERYEIVTSLGRGTFGEVFHAKRLPLGAPVALKVIRGEYVTPQVTERLEREAKVLQTVANSHVLAIHDIGWTSEKLPFLITELLEGETLADQMAAIDGSFGMARALEIIGQACRGLVPCHEVGVVHRDLKPSNIFLVDGTFVKIIDFGFARAYDDDGDRSVAKQVTTEGLVGGTPHYMAPEVIRGTTPTPAADVYALGLMLYELISWRTPFDADKPLSMMISSLRASPLQWAVMHVRAPRVPIRKAAPDLNVPESLEAVLTCALEIDPEQRWQHAGEFSAALAGVE
jgi:serine/threonine-protein kinase